MTVTTTPNNQTMESNQLEQQLEEKLSSIQIQEEEEKAKELAQKLNLPYLNLRLFPINQSSLSLVEENEARTGQLVVIYKSGQNMKIAALNPRAEITQKTAARLETEGFKIGFSVVSQRSLNFAWQKYSQNKEIESQMPGVVQIREEDLGSLQAQIQNLSDLKERLTSLSITKVLDILIAGALKIKASDIHLEPEENQVRLRYRLDGVLSDIVNFSPEGYPNILARIKLLSGLKINVHEIPQDGRFTIRQEKKDIEIRVSVLPGSYGENVVMRILDPLTIKEKLEDLGMRPDTLTVVRRLLAKTNGTILTTGPTGSGKTTTLYAFLRAVNDPGIKIITIEDPVEYHLEGISQTQVNPERGYTFANGLRSIVRQDPDVILVGEIRDSETAEIAMQAALTGHQVFSTLHTNDSAGAIPRLIDFGVKPQIIAPAINAAMAQRLVRKVCQACVQKKPAEASEIELLTKHLTGLKTQTPLPAIGPETELSSVKSCPECNFTGYKGQVAIFEIFEVDPDIERLILKSPAISEVKELAVSKGMITLLQDGLIKALNGVTTIEEVLRVVG